jgi:hypothetical protein
MKLPKRNKISNSKKINLNEKFTNKTAQKPSGIWYACSKSWFNWIIKQDIPEWFHKYIHKISLNKGVLTNINNKDPNKLLIIKNTKDFDLFNKAYGVLLPTYMRSKGYHNYYINWKKVSMDFAGIEICPYLINRKKYSWYLTWDVASGCIWNTSIINDTSIVYQKKSGKYVSS